MNTSKEDSEKAAQTETSASASASATSAAGSDYDPATAGARSVETDFDPATAEVEGEAEAERASLQRTIGDLRAELDKYKDLALRSVADLDNYRKRVAREKEDAIRYANAGFLERLVPILDNFELGLQAAKASGNGSAVLDGMGMVHKQLQDFLSSCGVETIEAQGERFDPNLHEAIAQEETAEVEEGVVLRQVRRGFRLRDRLLRPANVIVAKAASKPVADPQVAGLDQSGG